MNTGFNNTGTSCCEVATINEGGTGILCKRGGSICKNRSSHVFFDGLHPTEAVNLVIANKAYASNHKAEVYPMNLKQLSEIWIPSSGFWARDPVVYVYYAILDCNGSHFLEVYF